MHWLSSSRSHAAVGVPTHQCNAQALTKLLMPVGLEPSLFAWYLFLPLQAKACLWDVE